MANKQWNGFVELSSPDSPSPLPSGTVAVRDLKDTVLMANLKKASTNVPKTKRRVSLGASRIAERIQREGRRHKRETIDRNTVCQVCRNSGAMGREAQ